jgi:hypothetical protein
MPAIAYTTTTPILQAVKAWLVAWPILNKDVIYVVGDEEAPKMQATQIIQIWPQDMVDDKPVTHGAGRNAMHTTEPFWIQECVALATDTVDRAENAFMDARNGLYALRSMVIDAMQLFWPTDDAGNGLTVQPIHFGRGARGRKLPAPRSGHWITANHVFEIKYRHQLNLAFQ